MENNSCSWCKNKPKIIFSVKINYCPFCGRKLEDDPIKKDCSDCKWGLYDEYWKDYSCTKGVSCKDWSGWEPYEK